MVPHYVIPEIVLSLISDGAYCRATPCLHDRRIVLAGVGHAHPATNIEVGEGEVIMLANVVVNIEELFDQILVRPHLEDLRAEDVPSDPSFRASTHGFGLSEAVRIADAAAEGPVIVNFFASWCAPCQIEHPVLMGLKGRGIRIVGIAYKDKPPQSQALFGAPGSTIPM